MTPAETIRAEFEKARHIVRTSWSEREVLDALRTAEITALLAIGAEVCPHSHSDHLNVTPNFWRTPWNV